jgi:redox-sensitive bicupin YhaK (pirin superfamily)
MAGFDRKIKRVVRAFDTVEGGGVIVGRALPHRQVPLEEVDPFLLLDEARIDAHGPGFPEHPHRGFEIITYPLEGWGAHKDNMGNHGRIEAGGVMKLTAGSGIWHGEQAGADSKSASSQIHGIQFWVNLPKAEKQRKPEFQLLQPQEVLEKKEKGSLTRVLVGQGSPLRIVTPMNYLDVTVQPGAAWNWDLPEAWQGYVYVLDGKGLFGEGQSPAEDAQLAVLGNGSGLKAENQGKEPLRFLLAAGEPLRQPVIWNGPFVD